MHPQQTEGPFFVDEKLLRSDVRADSRTGVVRAGSSLESRLTIYPGWYPGRAVHVHFKVRTAASSSPAYEFTSQFYFDERLTDRVHSRTPYATHTGQRMRNESDGLFRDGGTQLTLPVTERGEGYAANFAVGMRPGDPPPRGWGRGRWRL